MTDDNDNATGRGQKIPAILPGELGHTDPGDGTHAVAITSLAPGEPLRSARYWAVYGAMVAALVMESRGLFGLKRMNWQAIVEEAHATAAWSEEVQP